MAYKQNNPFTKKSPAKGLMDALMNIKKSLQEGHERRKTTDVNYKKGRNPGESKYQYNVRTGSDFSTTKKGSSGSKPDTNNPPTPVKPYIPQEFKGEAGDKFRYRKTGEYTEGDATYSKFEFMDPDRPGEWIPAGKTKEGGWEGFSKIQNLYDKRFVAGELFDSPVEKNHLIKEE